MTDKKTIGRPRTLAERPTNKLMGLMPWEWDWLSAYGPGYTAAIRRLIQEQLERDRAQVNQGSAQRKR